MFWSLEDIKDIAISRMEQRWKSIPMGSEKPPNSNQFTLTRIYWTSKCCGAIYGTQDRTCQEAILSHGRLDMPWGSKQRLWQQLLHKCNGLSVGYM